MVNIPFDLELHTYPCGGTDVFNKDNGEFVCSFDAQNFEGNECDLYFFLQVMALRYMAEKKGTWSDSYDKKLGFS